jgi:hypothetical protein
VSGSYQVILADLSNAAGTYHTEAATMRALMPEGGPPAPSTGDGALDETLHTLMDAFGYLHAAISEEIKAHGDGLAVTHDNYQHCEVDVRELFDDLMPDDYTGA